MHVSDVEWRQPVLIMWQKRTLREFCTIYDALGFLENQWPRQRGEHYFNAVKICRAALARTISAEVAREAFIASCIEAGLLAVVPARKSRKTASGRLVA